ncbi:MAG: 30S ribosomal protein S1 [Candidatus Omnitrophica bacterium]|nr:30S ribosomal protein S1 [Candidatus Omnitrophota bacterium]
MEEKEQQSKDLEVLENDEKKEGSETPVLDFERLLEEDEDARNEPKEQELVRGKIVKITPQEVFVDIGYKAEGAISKEEFSQPQELKIGDEMELFLQYKQDRDGCIVVSKKKAERFKKWQEIVQNYKQGDLIEGEATRAIRGGLIIDIGIDAFLPSPMLSGKYFRSPTQLIKQKQKFKIVQLDKEGNVILSQQGVAQEENRSKRMKLLQELKKGEIIKGAIKSITDFGAFVDLGGIDGLLHITDITWGRISHPSEMLAVGDEIEVVVLNIDQERGRISLGLKQKTDSPWKEIDKKYPVGTKVKGKITNIKPYGIFLELEKGVEGLVHISAISWTKRVNNLEEMFAIGDLVEAVVLNLDKSKYRLGLGIKQLEEDPWTKIADNYPVGSKVKKKIRNLTDYGAFLELEPGIDGLIHISDISHKRIEHPQDVLEKGQEVEVIVLSVEPEKRKIRLGLKQLGDEPDKESSL